jgi:hypothetical protein
MTKLKDIYEGCKIPKVVISSDNFTNILAEDKESENKKSEVNSQILKIIVEEDFLDDAILALYKAGASKYNLKFEVVDKSEISAYLSGISLNLIKFLLDISEMLLENIKEKYPNLNIDEYIKLNK